MVWGLLYSTYMHIVLPKNATGKREKKTKKEREREKQGCQEIKGTEGKEKEEKNQVTMEVLRGSSWGPDPYLGNLPYLTFVTVQIFVE
jgi:hypothetical protein